MVERDVGDRSPNFLNSSPYIHLRPATQSEAHLLWQWANEPQVRAMSFSTEPIPWKDHSQWFSNKLKNPDCYLWIALVNAKPIGYVRFDTICLREVDISISLAPEMRGKGYAKLVIQAACYRLLEETDIHTIHAHIKAANLASIRAFESAHFIQRDSISTYSSEAVHYQYQSASHATISGVTKITED